MAGVVGFEPTVHGIKTRGYCYQELSGKSRKLLSKVLSKPAKMCLGKYLSL